MLYLFVGKSGSGKSTVADILSKRGMKVLHSYTTRPQRYDGEDGHIFISYQEAENMINNSEVRLVGKTVFADNIYFATEQQAIDSDIYIIDVNGVKYFKEYNKSKIENGEEPMDYKVIFFDIDDKLLYDRMIKRGSTEEEAINRVAHDKEAFSEINRDEVDYFVAEQDIDKTMEVIDFILKINK